MVDLFFHTIYTFTYPIRRLMVGIGHITPGFNRLPAVSPQFRLALMVLLFLLIIWGAALVKQLFFSQGRAELNWLLWFGVGLPLVIVIPIIFFFLVRFWMIQEKSRFPGIDAIWDQAMGECASQGITMTNVPLFLVLGNPDLRRANQLSKASLIQFAVSVPEGGNPPIAFYANQDAAFLFLDGCSCISGLSNGPMGSPSAGAIVAKSAGGASPMATLDPSSAGSSGEPASPSAGPSPTGTLTESGIIQAGGGPSPATRPSAGAGATLQLNEGESLGDIAGNFGSEPPPQRAFSQLPSQEIYDREQRLKHVCRLVTGARSSLCPINGILTLIPFDLIESASGQIQSAAQKDLAILREELKVRCSVTVVVTEMERDEGFQELIKRVGTEKSRDFRFGKGCELWSAPERDRLKAVAVHAASAFEDWTYTLFQEADALQHKHNSRLFRLLCRIRGSFTENLQQVLAHGFGFDPRTEGFLAHEQFLFGGCYFGAAGGRSGQHAFLKSVFQKMQQQEGELEWAPSARRLERNYQMLGSMFALLGGVSLLATIAMIVYWALQQGPDG